MGQTEVYDLLKNKRLSGDDRFFAITDIKKMFINCPSDTNSIKTVSDSLLRLYNWGLIESKNYEYRFKTSKIDNSLI